MTWSPLASAAPHNVCVPRALGVPTRNESPKWVNWAGSSGNLDTSLDDPRWQGATGHSFNSGSAKAPLQLRALWSDQGGEYLYMSFIMDLEGLSGIGSENPRDLFLGFRRVRPFDPGTPSDPSDDQQGYIFQFHLKGGAEAALVDPIHCARPIDSSPGANDGCSEDAATPKDHWRLYVDLGQPGTCSGAPTARHFSPLTGSGGVMDSPAPWMADKQAVRYWKESTANRWAIQLRIPIVDPGASTDPVKPITAGIERGARFWYQATTVATAGNFTNIGWWPREIPSSICYSTAAGGFLDHDDLTTVDSYSGLTTYDGMLPATCDAGIRLTTDGVGSIPDYTGTAIDLPSQVPTTRFKGVRADGVTPVVNTVVALPENTSATVFDKPLMGRFRLASWGSAPWSDPGDTGKWKDMRGTVPTAAGQQPGICLGSSDPNAPDNCLPAGTIAAGAKGAISFQWTIGNDAVLGASEYCKFGLVPPGGSCGACSCLGAPSCDAATDTGTRATVGTTTFPCVSRNFYHQCMLVELSAPNGNVEFVQQSAWNNMNFDQMSAVAREALIDARALPKGKDQKEQDIYLIVMPRNMPKAFPAGTKDGATYVREQALERAEKISEPYVRDIAHLSPEEIIEIARKVGRPVEQQPAPSPGGPQTHTVPPKISGAMLERYRRVARSLVIMPNKDFKAVGGLLSIVENKKELNAADLNEAAVRAVGAQEAANIIPTLEIYPFYQPLGRGKAYMPMTAFTVFLSHEGAMKGMNWTIDGVEQVGQNVFHLRIPVGYARKIQVRALAVEATELLPPPNPKWPCAGGCCTARNCGLVGQVGNAWPGLLAGLYVTLRGRRRRRRMPTQAL
ncbi:MAG TPA: hypothetical protein VN253_26000 [Kofleriaceae bacterium]|nr:hypothetical protein [Kofleriaceae bacterium]